MKFNVIGKPIEALASEIERLEQDNARLRALIKEAEWNGIGGERGMECNVCPWCDEDAFTKHRHDDTYQCPAFTPEGEVK